MKAIAVRTELKSTKMKLGRKELNIQPEKLKVAVGEVKIWKSKGSGRLMDIGADNESYRRNRNGAGS